MIRKYFLIFILIAIGSNAQAPSEPFEIVIDGKKSTFFDIVPQEVYGDKGNFLLCFNCETCKNKTFQRFYLRGHLGRIK